MKNLIFKPFLITVLFILGFNASAQTNVTVTNNIPANPTCISATIYIYRGSTLLATTPCLSNGSTYTVLCLGGGRITHILVDDCAGCTPFSVGMNVTGANCGSSGCGGSCYCINVDTVQTTILPTPVCPGSPDTVNITLY